MFSFCSLDNRLDLYELNDENLRLKNDIFCLRTTLESKERTLKESDDQIRFLQIRITELEDWNDDDQS